MGLTSAVGAAETVHSYVGPAREYCCKSALKAGQRRAGHGDRDDPRLCREPIDVPSLLLLLGEVSGDSGPHAPSCRADVGVAPSRKSNPSERTDPHCSMTSQLQNQHVHAALGQINLMVLLCFSMW